MWESLPEEAPALIEDGYRLLEHAVELDPNSDQAQTSFGVLGYARQEWSEAEQNFRNALALRENSDTLRNYGNMLARAGRSAAARSQFAKADAIDPLFSSLPDIFDSPEMVLSRLRAAYADATLQWPSKLHDIAMLAACFGDPEFSLQVKGEEARSTSIRDFSLWYPVIADVRRLSGFKVLVADNSSFWPIRDSWVTAYTPDI